MYHINTHDILRVIYQKTYYILYIHPLFYSLFCFTIHHSVRRLGAPAVYRNSFAGQQYFAFIAAERVAIKVTFPTGRVGCKGCRVENNTGLVARAQIVLYNIRSFESRVVHAIVLKIKSWNTFGIERTALPNVF